MMSAWVVVDQTIWQMPPEAMGGFDAPWEAPPEAMGGFDGCRQRHAGMLPPECMGGFDAPMMEAQCRLKQWVVLMHQ